MLKLADAYLQKAWDENIRHALFAVDNDGGARRRPEHVPDHDAAAHAADEDDGCRVCWLSESLPRWWSERGGRRIIVVPVQTLETWLLFLRGDPMQPSPEQRYARRVLKKQFFGKVIPPVETRAALALAEIEKPDAIERLRRRRSFRDFEEQLADWR